ncbi:cytochrome c [Aureibaculum sp. 2210JD6-5]|uniref:c-type cytochrome n=1 Tax=Aureibaculum sp. 2210JD6-5 TaxID=3103957 RepID=UPI002AAD8D4E|nr:cytochrome c [Aureibaculum sp. 2210JD6-5]MDY7395374.1 cytochrome c [Aureibaculum sp. 2210JD6-5]
MTRLLFSFLIFLWFFNAFGQDETKNDDFMESIDRGIIVYEDFCMNCHLPDGKGVEKVTPPLAGSDYLINKRLESIKAVKFGQSGEIVVNGKKYNGTMAPMGLSNKEIADVMNYITTNFGNTNTKMFTEQEVSKIEK